MDDVLVVGGAGYIGSVLVPQLLRNGYQVTVLDNFMYKQNSLLDVCYHSNLDIIVGDVRDKQLLKEKVGRHDIIVPLAAIVGAPACDKDKSLATAVNLHFCAATPNFKILEYHLPDAEIAKDWLDEAYWPTDGYLQLLILFCMQQGAAGGFHLVNCGRTIAEPTEAEVEAVLGDAAVVSTP